MKEFIEKLIGRLEEEKNTAYKTYETFEMKVDLGRAFGIEGAIEIVNQLVEEYKTDTTFQYVLLQTDIMKRMGIDVSCKWETATQQASALNEAYMRGRQDERDRFAEWQDEHNGGWIPCSERLPQEDEPKGALCKVVNVIMKNGTVTSGWCNRLLKKWYVLDYHSAYPIAHEYKDIIAWQPLPDEPYTDELDAKPCANTECVYQRNEPCPAHPNAAGHEEIVEKVKEEE